MRRVFWTIIVVSILISIFGDDDDATNSTEQTPVETVSEASIRQVPQAVLYVTGNRVNQRVAPSTSQPVQGQLAARDKVRKVSENGNWTEIASPIGRGWMHSAYLNSKAPTKTPKTSQQKKRTIAAPSSKEVAAATRDIIQQSIRSYPGSCPCPYNRDRGGRRCGGRSAWSKPGGYSPICYASDISKARLASYFARKRGATN